MPVPWAGNGYERPHFPLASKVNRPRDRAITLRQLRELRELVKRLCKAGLLKFPATPFNERRNCAGKRIRWTQITQHEIVSEIVKRIIPQRHSCSWMEVVSCGNPQERRFYCSHNWSEPFRDFMATIEHHAREHRAGPEDAYWICVFANDQWDVNLGTSLCGSPFYDALHNAEMTALMLDETAEALYRMWVVFEMTETQRLGQVLEVWTPLGRVGSGLVASGPFVQAVKNLDITLAEASNPCDQRQIMNHIAGVEEHTGIVVNSAGDKELDPEFPDDYEERLVKANLEKFTAWNERLKRQAAQWCKGFLFETDTTPALTPRTEVRRIPDPSLRGITLEQLRSFDQNLRAWLVTRTFASTRRRSQLQYLDENTMTLQQVLEWYIIPTTSTCAGCCSYVELVADRDQRPEYHITSTWSCTTLSDFMSAVEWHAEARELSDATVYWVDFLAMNHHTQETNERGEGDVASDTATDASYAHELRKSVIVNHASGVMLVMDREAQCLSFGSVVFEVYLAVDASRSLDLLTSGGCLATTRPFVDGGWVFGDFDAAIAEAGLQFNVQDAHFTDNAARNAVLNHISSDIPGYPESPVHGNCKFREGLEVFNQRLRRKFAGPVLIDAAFDGDMGKIERVLAACPRLKLDSAGLRGPLGEKALHCAAAAGHVEVVRRLIEAKSDMDTQDMEGETPLHYAALAGQTQVARFLLNSKADPSVESWAAEWAIEVAEQNPAYFLGVETAGVMIELSRYSRISQALGRPMSPAAQGVSAEARSSIGRRGNKSGKDVVAKSLRACCKQGRLAWNKVDALIRAIGGEDPDQIDALLVSARELLLEADQDEVDCDDFVAWLFDEAQ